MALKDNWGTDRNMTAGRQETAKGAGSDPYNKAGKAEGRDASSWKGSGTLTRTGAVKRVGGK